MFAHAEEEGTSGGQEEVALFMGDTAFMQGAIGLTLMPSHASTRIPASDLAHMARLVLGSDKLFGFFMPVRLLLLLLLTARSFLRERQTCRGFEGASDVFRGCGSIRHVQGLREH